jgi:hypothetical protein
MVMPDDTDKLEVRVKPPVWINKGPDKRVKALIRTFPLNTVVPPTI